MPKVEDQPKEKFVRTSSQESGAATRLSKHHENIFPKKKDENFQNIRFRNGGKSTNRVDPISKKLKK